MTSGTFASFVLERRIAVGGTSEVYLARSLTNDGRFPAEFVLKRPLPDFQRDPKFGSMFAREAQLQSRITHPNVVKVLDFGRADGESYLVTEYVDGVDTDRLLRRLRHEQRRLDPALIAYLGAQLFEGLAAVHEAAGFGGRALGIVHRDISPSNVYLARNGAVKLGDFGLAHSLHDAQWRSQTGTAMKGKFGYLAPEQVSGEPADQRADLFSAASVLSEFLLGQPLFPSEGQLTVLLAIRDARIDPLLQLDSPLVPILQRVLTRSPADRTIDARGLARALSPFAMHRHDAESAIAQEIEHHRQGSQRLYTPRTGVGATRATSTARMDSSAHRRALVRGTLVAGAHPHGYPLRQEVPTQRPRGGEQEPATGRYPLLSARVHLRDGTVTGPHSYAQLVERIATGEIDRGDRLELEGRGLVPVEQLNELARFLRPARAAERPPTSERPVVSAQARDILQVLGSLYANQETGVLIAERSRPTAHKEIYLHQGLVHHVHSSDKNELLGEYLCRRGLLDRSELEFALGALPAYGGRLGDTLIALGLADPIEIFRAIRAQGRDRVLDLFRWQDGELAFRRAPESPEVEFPLELDLLAVLWAGLDIAERTHGVEAMDAELDRRLCVARLPHGSASTLLPAFAHVLGVLRQPASLRDLLGSAQGAGAVSPDEVTRATRVLLSCGVLAWVA